VAAIGCSSGPATAPSTPEPVERGAVAVLRGGRLAGGRAVDVRVEDGRIAEAGPDLEVPGGADLVDVSGRFLAPAFVDSHVHLAYYPVGEELSAAGVAGAVDLAAPMRFLEQIADEPLHVVAAGPMLTAPGGYPTRSWGRDGYGLECPDAGACAAAVTRLHTAGAGVIKVAVTGPPALDDAALRAIVERAHALELDVVAHALSDTSARRAADAGVDVLAHTPVERLSDETVRAWGDRAVISTLGAFGGGGDAVENLRRLRAGGAAVLYGTDLGNSRDASIDARELRLLEAAGLDGEAILAAGTAAPARRWSLDGDLGAIAPGRAAAILVLEADPREDPATLAEPVAVHMP